MKYNKIIFIMLLAVVLVFSACASKKGRYEKCSHFSKKALCTEQVHGRI